MGDAEVDIANERNVLQMPASVPCRKGVSERAATATVTCLFHFPHAGGSRATLLHGVQGRQGEVEKQEDKSIFEHQGKK